MSCASSGSSLLAEPIQPLGTRFGRPRKRHLRGVHVIGEVGILGDWVGFLLAEGFVGMQWELTACGRRSWRYSLYTSFGAAADWRAWKPFPGDDSVDS